MILAKTISIVTPSMGLEKQTNLVEVVDKYPVYLKLGLFGLYRQTAEVI